MENFITIYLIRHARQMSPLCNVDVELSAEGREQAYHLAERMKDYPVQLLYSSHLKRAEETAGLINTWQAEYRIRTELREIDFGDLTGHSDEYIHTQFSALMKERKKLDRDIAFPGGECGSDVWERSKRVLDEIIKSGKHTVAAVTHGGTIRSILAGIMNMNQARKLQFGVTLENTGITKLVYNREYDRFTLEGFNDAAHLEAFPHLLRKNWR